MKISTVELREASRRLSDYVPEQGAEPIIITRDGKPVAALVPLENTDLETASLSTNPRFLELIERSRSRWRQEGGIPSAEMRRRLARANS